MSGLNGDWYEALKGEFSKPYYRKLLNVKDLCPEDWTAIPISGKIALYFHAGGAFIKKVIRKIRCIGRL